ncbi:nucleotidyltransferase family protein [bacterium]|nr:nucleotidyltransferase family protein [bacterium]
MLKRAQILELLRSSKDDLERRYSVRRIGLFGSVIRGEESAGSDIDIVVDMKHPTFDKYMDLKFHLERVIGREVDLVLLESIKPRLKSVISRETVYA